MGKSVDVYDVVWCAVQCEVAQDGFVGSEMPRQAMNDLIDRITTAVLREGVVLA